MVLSVIIDLAWWSTKIVVSATYSGMKIITDTIYVKTKTKDELIIEREKQFMIEFQQLMKKYDKIQIE